MINWAIGVLYFECPHSEHQTYYINKQAKCIFLAGKGLRQSQQKFSQSLAIIWAGLIYRTQVPHQIRLKQSKGRVRTNKAINATCSWVNGTHRTYSCLSPSSLLGHNTQQQQLKKKGLFCSQFEVVSRQEA